MKIDKAFEMLMNDESLEFRCDRKDGGYSILNRGVGAKGYFYVNNYNENNQREVGVREGFNGMIPFNAEWKLISKPVLFGTVLQKAGGNKVKVVYHPLNINTKFDIFAGIIKCLSETYASRDLADIIRYGDWYIEAE